MEILHTQKNSLYPTLEYRNPLPHLLPASTLGSHHRQRPDGKESAREKRSRARGPHYKTPPSGRDLNSNGPINVFKRHVTTT